MTGLVFGGAGLVVLGLVVWAGHRMLLGRRRPGDGMATALGNYMDVFGPEIGRADRELRSRENQGEVAPSPDDHDLPVRVDLESGQARISPSAQPGRRAPLRPRGPR